MNGVTQIQHRFRLIGNDMDSKVPTFGHTKKVGVFGVKDKVLTQEEESFIQSFSKDGWEVRYMDERLPALTFETFWESLRTCDECARNLQGDYTNFDTSELLDFCVSKELEKELIEQIDSDLDLISFMGPAIEYLPWLFASKLAGVPQIKKIVRYADFAGKVDLPSFSMILSLEAYALRSSQVSFITLGTKNNSAPKRIIKAISGRKRPFKKVLVSGISTKHLRAGVVLLAISIPIRNLKLVIRPLQILLERFFRDYQIVTGGQARRGLYRKRVALLIAPLLFLGLMAPNERLTRSLTKIPFDKLLPMFSPWPLRMPNHLLRELSRAAGQEGSLFLRFALLQIIVDKTGSNGDREDLQRVYEELIELDPRWAVELHSSPQEKLAIWPVSGRVLHLHKVITPFEFSGGAVRSMQIVREQVQAGLKPAVMTPLGYPAYAGHDNLPQREEMDLVSFYRPGGDLQGVRSLSNLETQILSAKALLEVVKEFRPEVIHAASGVRGYELVQQALAIRNLTGIPVVYEVRSFHEQTWTREENPSNREKTHLRMAIENKSITSADHTIVISEQMKKELLNRGIASKHVSVVPNGVTEEIIGKFEGASPKTIPELDGAEFVIGYISNMSPREGHVNLIDALKILKQKYDNDFRLLFVGTGNQMDNLKFRAKELGRNVVFFAGNIEHSEIGNYYKAIDVFVVPRIADYAGDFVTPLKPYEAMLAGVPLVVTDRPALVEIVGDEEDRGIVAKSNDPTSLANSIARVWEDSASARLRAQNAKKWILSERTWGQNQKILDEIYKRVKSTNEET